MRISWRNVVGVVEVRGFRPIESWAKKSVAYASPAFSPVELWNTFSSAPSGACLARESPRQKKKQTKTASRANVDLFKTRKKRKERCGASMKQSTSCRTSRSRGAYNNKALGPLK